MKLVDHTVRQYVAELGSGSATPGGGSAAAGAGAMATGLCAMVARFTAGKQKYVSVAPQMEAVIQTSESLTDRFLYLLDADADAYGQVMAAYRLPKGTKVHKTGRAAAIQKAFREAADIPMETLRSAHELSGLLVSVVKHGNPACISDAGAAVHLCRTCAHVAGYNVTINLNSIEDTEYVRENRKTVGYLLAKVDGVLDELEKYVVAAL